MNKELEELKAKFADRYAVQREIGRGGMATVYLAEDLKHGRAVALKVLRPDLAAVMGHERFLQEIGISARLRHPNILPLFDSGETGQTLFYVMPFVQGESVRDRLNREKQLSLDDALQIAREVADALGYAHSHDIVHRDIKPENIMLEGGHATVTDFGIAYAISPAADERLTSTGLAVGTAAYMCPEQAAGNADIDGRADIYALGCVLYEMLAGEPPFSGPSTQALMARHSAAPVPRLRTIRDTVPEAVERAIIKALAKVPADRFATAQEFKTALTQTAAVDTAAHTMFATSARGPASPRSVAVLPFANMSADPENEFLSDGITEELIHALNKIQDLQVVARTSAFAFKGKSEDLRAVGDRLNVSTVLEGSVRRAGSRLRTTAQLVNVADGFPLWSERYDHELKDIFEVQDDISRAIVEALRVEWLEEARSRPATAPGSEAWELYLKGRFFWNQRTETGLQQAVEHLRRALDQEPEFALALASLADCYVTLALYGIAAPDEVMPIAKKTAGQALEIDSALAEPLTTLGCISSTYEWDWAQAEEHFRKSLALQPAYPTAHHWYAINLLAPLGRFQEARAELREARESDPISPAIGSSIGLLYFLEGRTDAAIQRFKRVIDGDPQFGLVHYFLGQAYESQLMHADAVQAFEAAIQLMGDSSEIVAALAHAHGAAGEAHRAQELLTELIERAEDHFVSPALLAQVHLGLGEVDTALDCLECAHDMRAPEMVWLNVRPVFEPLRTHERFKALVAEIGLPERVMESR